MSIISFKISLVHLFRAAELQHLYRYIFTFFIDPTAHFSWDLLSWDFNCWAHSLPFPSLMLLISAPSIFSKWHEFSSSSWRGAVIWSHVQLFVRWLSPTASHKNPSLLWNVQTQFATLIYTAYLPCKNYLTNDSEPACLLLWQFITHRFHFQVSFLLTADVGTHITHTTSSL